MRAAPVSSLVRAVDIPFEQFTLPNGLRVIVHTDRKAPIVAVSVWYGVGSKDEPNGRSGFAHLFEHLMFNGSENYDKEFFEPLEEVGATDFWPHRRSDCGVHPLERRDHRHPRTGDLDRQDSSGVLD